MVDKNQIMGVLKTYFLVSGDVTIDDTGLVNCTSNVELREGFLVKQLPVSFGSVGGSFWCSRNTLTTLAGVPQTVGGGFMCSYTQLTTLEGAPNSVGGDFWCYNNQLTTLAGAPQTVGRRFICYNNPLESLEGIPTQLSQVKLTYSPTLPLLRTLYAQKIEFFPKLRDPTLLEILNRYAGQGKRGAIRCQKELIAAGFEGNAKW